MMKCPRFLTMVATSIAIVVVSAAIFALSLWLVRSQQTIGDVAWMKEMMPHHSIAILTGERAHITDPRVRKLADGTSKANVERSAK